MKGSLNELFGKTVRQEPDVTLRVDPKQGDKQTDGPEMLGKCVAWHRQGKSLFGFTVQIAGRPNKSVDYYDVEIDCENDHLKMVTGARKVWLIEIRGRLLKKLEPLLKERKVDWMTHLDRDFGQDDGEPVITALEITDVTERERPSE